MAWRWRDDELVRGKKRRGCQIGGLEMETDGEEGWSGEMDAMLEVLVKKGDVTRLKDALERIMGKQETELDRGMFLDKSFSFGCHLQDHADKLARHQASQHNAAVWPLTQDLTVKIFSLLGTQSLCQAAASCNMFNKLATDPACYVEVDLTMRGTLNNVSDRTVTKLVQRAGQCLRSLKLGALPRQYRNSMRVTDYYIDKVTGAVELVGVPLPEQHPLDKVLPARCMAHAHDRHEVNFLTKNCLESLTASNLLTRLHLFNLDKMDSDFLCRALAACHRLTDLEVVGLKVSLRSLLECLGSHCPNLTRLCCQPGKLEWTQYREESIKTKSCNQLVKGCPDLSYLALRGYGVSDKRANELLKGLPKLTVVDFCGALRLTGVFLRGVVGPGDQQSHIETILLRDCQRLKEVEVERFLYMLIIGECRKLRLLDISNKGGLAARDWFDKRLSPSTEQAILRVRQERTELCLLADFPDQNSSESDPDSFDTDDSGPLGTYSSDFSSDTSISDSSDSDDDDDSGFMSHEDYNADPDLEQADSDMSLVSLDHGDDLSDPPVEDEDWLEHKGYHARRGP